MLSPQTGDDDITEERVEWFRQVDTVWDRFIYRSPAVLLRVVASLLLDIPFFCEKISSTIRRTPTADDALIFLSANDQRKRTILNLVQIQGSYYLASWLLMQVILVSDSAGLQRRSSTRWSTQTRKCLPISTLRTRKRLHQKGT
jgi:hypothetical protein